MGTPVRKAPFFLRGLVASWYASGGAAAVAPDFAANTLATVMGGATGGLVPGYHVEIEKLRFIAGNVDFAGAAGTLTFELRKNSITGTAIASITLALAATLRGVVQEGVVSAANNEAAKLFPADSLFLVRLAAGTVFTTGEGQWEIIGRQMPQSRGA